ncbi:hypothetical protein POM88_035862 [Heracleum sosnowskyi]|uniref:Transposase n=1 Tax=Heracleum sosnowskyi TaxID=360622 RepID=A0AAD8HM41_9APIA|nr:hypothetical protein POM88_035862 [Heracleum sosnowskyi]
MDKVHTRPFEKRVVISVNNKFQPVADDDQKISELRNFLGTLKRCVPLTYASWEHVPESLKDTFWSCTKQHYIIPEECRKWSMKTIQTAWKGYKSRTKRDHYTPYATDDERLQNKPEEIPLEEFKLLLNYWGDPDVQERAEKNSKSRGEYKDTHTVGPKLFSQIQHNMETIKKKLNSSEGVDGIEELLSGGKKSHVSSDIVGDGTPVTGGTSS